MFFCKEVSCTKTTVLPAKQHFCKHLEFKYIEKKNPNKTKTKKKKKTNKTKNTKKHTSIQITLFLVLKSPNCLKRHQLCLNLNAEYEHIQKKLISSKALHSV